MYSIYHKGYKIRAIDEGNMDFGLEIIGPQGDLLYFNPSCLSSSKWGYNGDLEWSEKEWRNALKEHADSFINEHIDTKEDEYAGL